MHYACWPRRSARSSGRCVRPLAGARIIRLLSMPASLAQSTAQTLQITPQCCVLPAPVCMRGLGLFPPCRLLWPSAHSIAFVVLLLLSPDCRSVFSREGRSLPLQVRRRRGVASRAGPSSAWRISLERSSSTIQGRIAGAPACRRHHPPSAPRLRTLRRRAKPALTAVGGRRAPTRRARRLSSRSYSTCARLWAQRRKSSSTRRDTRHAAMGAAATVAGASSPPTMAAPSLPPVSLLRDRRHQRWAPDAIRDPRVERGRTSSGRRQCTRPVPTAPRATARPLRPVEATAAHPHGRAPPHPRAAVAVVAAAAAGALRAASACLATRAPRRMHRRWASRLRHRRRRAGLVVPPA